MLIYYEKKETIRIKFMWWHFQLTNNNESGPQTLARDWQKHKRDNLKEKTEFSYLGNGIVNSMCNERKEWD